MANLYLLDFPSGKSYVGITTKLAKKRLSQHVATARTGSKLLISKAIRKYGVPTLTVLAEGTISQMSTLEIAMIDGLNTLAPCGYNLDKGGSIRNMGNDERAACSARFDDASYRERCLAGLHSPESRARAAESNRGKKRTPEQRARMSAGMRGVKRSPASPERRRQISEWMKRVWAKRQMEAGSA